MKKICVFIPSLEYGGAERVTSILCNYFAESGIQTYLIIGKVSCAKEYNLHENVSRINICNNREKGVLQKIMKCRKMIKEIKPDVVLVMFAPMYILVYLAIYGLHIPCVVSERNDPKRFSGRKITKIMYQYFIKKSNGIVFQTEDARKYYHLKDRAISKIIMNPIEERIFPEIHTGIRENVIVNIGRLHSQKNQRLLIKAFCDISEKFPEYKLNIYGDGELRDDLNTYIEYLNLQEKVVIYNSCQDVLEQIRKSRLFVLSSNYEGMPNALLEALCLGIPSISTDCPCGGPKELKYIFGQLKLVPVGDTKALSRAISDELNDQCNLEYEDIVAIRSELSIKKIGEEWIGFLKQFTD